MTRADWDRWAEQWRAPVASGDTEHIALASARAQRTMARARLVEMLVMVGALGILGGSLLHAATATEAVTALGVGAIIAAVWLRRLTDRRDEARSLAAPTAEYDDVARRLLRRQLALARYVIIVVMLLLVFLVPWWLAGAREHAHQDPLAAFVIWTVWLPIAAMTALFAWGVRLHLSARRGLRLLALTPAKPTD